jgi:hypothetical protein
MRVVVLTESLQARRLTVEASVIVPAIAALRAHPRFAEAARRCAQGIVDAYSGNRLLNSLLNDRGRVLFGLMTIHLHYYTDRTGTGLTPARMAQLCEETDICSRGRAKALLALLRWAGYLAPQPGGIDRRQRPLAPTERMLGGQIERWRRQFEAIAMVDPDGTAALAQLSDPDFVGRFACAMGLGYRAGFRVLDHAPGLKPFADSNNGFLLLASLALAGPRDGPMPASGPVDLSVSQLASRLHVSRAHVVQVLRKAEEEGLLVRTNHGGRPQVQCLPPLADALDGFFAASLAYLRECARRAMAEGEIQSVYRQEAV